MIYLRLYDFVQAPSTQYLVYQERIVIIFGQKCHQITTVATHPRATDRDGLA